MISRSDTILARALIDAMAANPSTPDLCIRCHTARGFAVAIGPWWTSLRLLG